MSVNWTGRRKRFRQLLQADKCNVPITVFDSMSARMAEDLGFEVGMLAGSVAAMAILGAPDKVLITASEFVDLAHRICRAGDLAVIADADHGYGNALNVSRTVAELDHAGVAALTIEDTNLPQPFNQKGPQLLSIEEGTVKMKAAVAGRVDPALVIIGRTSAAAISDRQNCLHRIKAYAEAGLDAIALIGVQTQEDLESLCAATSLPIMLGGLAPNIADRGNLAKLGVRICLMGHQPYRAALQATYQAMQQAKGLLSAENGPTLADDRLIKQLTRDTD